MSALIGRGVIARFAKERSVIFMSSHGPCPVFARGDKRTTATHWLSQKTVKGMIAEGCLIKDGKGYSLAPTLRSRLLNPVEERAFTEQHGSAEEREIYTPEKALRRARVNTSFSALRRLGKTRDGGGKPKLPPELIEAGERYAHDYENAGLGMVSGQNFEGSGADGATRHDSIENSHLRRIDAQKRRIAAQSALGPKLDAVVIAVCCNSHDLEALERAEGWARGAGLPILRLALEQLARHYGTRIRRRAPRSELPASGGV